MATSRFFAAVLLMCGDGCARVVPCFGSVLNLALTGKYVRPKESCFDVLGCLPEFAPLRLKGVSVAEDELIGNLVDAKLLLRTPPPLGPGSGDRIPPRCLQFCLSLGPSSSGLRGVSLVADDTHERCCVLDLLYLGCRRLSAFEVTSIWCKLASESRLSDLCQRVRQTRKGSELQPFFDFRFI